MLPLLFLLHTVLAKETQKVYPITSPIDSCPDVGYFFKREIVFNAIQPGQCFLCFCQDNGTALCWPRKNRRCDVKHYDHGRKKRDSGARVRRNPGFSDIFFRDATRDVFNRHESAEQCKPFESSYSDGCPPADWCIGCTVCDCDANGRWDCHILSFCPNDKGKTKPKRRAWKSSYRGRNKVKRQLSSSKKPSTPKKSTSQLKKTTKTPQVKKIQSKKQQKKNPNKSNNKTKASKIKQTKVQMSNFKPKKQTKNNQKKPKQYKKQQNKVNKTLQIKKPIPRKQQKKTINAKSKATTKKIVQNNLTKKPLTTKPSKEKREVANPNDSTVKFAQTIMKHVMASVEKILNESQKNLKKTSNAKVVQKRSMANYNNKHLVKYKNKSKRNTAKKQLETKNQMKSKQKISSNKLYQNSLRNNRKKREIMSVYSFPPSSTVSNTISPQETLSIYTEKVLLPSLQQNSSKDENYFKYSVDLKNTVTEISQITETKTTAKTFLSAVSTTNTTQEENELVHNNRVTYVENKPRFLNNISLKCKRIENKDNLNNTLIIKYISLKKQHTFLALNVTHNKTERVDNILNKINFTKGGFKNVSCGNICEFTNLFKKLSRGVSKKNHTRSNGKAKRVMIYVRNFFNNMFSKKHQSTKNITKKCTRRFHRRSIIDTLCSRIGPCKFNSTDKMLHLKLNELKTESRKILKSVKIIKGLLKLIQRNSGYTNSSKMNNPLSESYDLNELRVIIQENNNNANDLLNLTETQRTQFAYMKNNIQVFIGAIEKFSYILNDLIRILTKNNTLQRKHTFPLLQHETKNNIITKHKQEKEMVTDKLDKLKTLLISYNLLQNRFMKKMYEVLLTLEQKETSTNKIQLLKVSGNNTVDESVAVETYTTNILKNLRKLQNLTKRLSFKSRRKRESIGDDDAVDYLLILMEYLLKQKQPLDIPPVNDGIDLLIDAIKNAPGIKTIKKKVLDFMPVESVTGSTKYIQNISEEKLIVENKNDQNKPKVNRFKAIDLVDDNESGELYHHTSINENVNQKLLYSLGSNNTADISKNMIEVTTDLIVGADLSKLNKFEEDILENASYENNKGTGKRYEVFSDDVDDEDTTIISSTFHDDWETNIQPTTTNNPIKTQPSFKKTINKISSQNDEIYSYDDLKIEHAKMKLDWIEKNFDQESKLPNITETTTELLLTSQVVTQTATRTAKRFKDKYADPISSVSIESEDDKVLSKKINAGYKKSKKQMDLLNSLDYWTEKAEIDMDSKEDKYSSDSFSTYFV